MWHPLRELERTLWKTEKIGLFSRLLRALLTVIRLVMSSQLRLYTSALTYTTILTIVPLLAILFTILKSFQLDSMLRETIQSFLAPMGASGSEATEYLLSFVSNAQAGVLGTLGIIFFFYSIFLLIQKIEVSLNYIWHVDVSRRIKTKVIGYFGAFVLAIIIAALAVTLNLAFHKNELVSQWSNNMIVQTFSPYFAKILSILTTSLVLAILYMTIPNTQVRFKGAFFGGLFCTLLWIPLTSIFTTIIGKSTSYSAIYSSFATIVILLIWLDILWVLFLLGANISYFVQYPNQLKPHTDRPLNPTELEHYAKKMMAEIIEHFSNKQGPISLLQLSQYNPLSHIQIQSVLAPFIENQTILNYDQAKQLYILGMNPKDIDEAYILQTIRGELIVGVKD